MRNLETYGPVSRWLHWLAAGLIVLVFLLGLGMDVAPRGAMRSTTRMLHESLGIVALAVCTLRLCWVLLRPGPPPLGQPGLQRLAARLGHLALYVMTLAVPLSGMVREWARGRDVGLFGWPLPAPFPIPGGRAWGEVHETLSWAFAVLVALHLLAVLWHTLVLRDGTLARMTGRRAA